MFGLACSVIACASGGTPTTTPAQASAVPAIAETAPPSMAPSPSAEPTVAPTVAIDLAALLPGTVAGTTLVRANDDATLSPDPASDMGRMLAAVGATAADIRMASAYDPSGALPVEIIALAFDGVTGSQIVAGLHAAGPEREIEQILVEGTSVLRVTAPGEATGRYVFVDGDVFFVVVGANDALATEAVTAIVR